MKLLTDKELDIILIAILQDENAEDICLPLDSKNRKSIQFHLSVENYSTLLYTQGVPFIKGLLSHYSKIEQFEKCAKIVAAIQQHNSFDNDNKLSTEIK